MKLFRFKKRLLPWQKPLAVLLSQVLADQLLQQFVPVKLTDHAAGVVVVGDIGGILGQKIAHNLIDGIIALFLQRIEYRAKNASHILFVVTGNGKFQSALISHGIDLLGCNNGIISQNGQRVKT